MKREKNMKMCLWWITIMYDLCISYKAIDEKKMKNVKTKERMTKEEKKHVENGNYSFIWEQMKKKK